MDLYTYPMHDCMNLGSFCVPCRFVEKSLDSANDTMPGGCDGKSLLKKGMIKIKNSLQAGITRGTKNP